MMYYTIAFDKYRVPNHTLTGLQVAESILPRWMPMLIPPRPWIAPNNGGYLTHQALIMRIRGSGMQLDELFQQHKQGKLKQVHQQPLPFCQRFWFI